jgi:hypothetical protein
VTPQPGDVIAYPVTGRSGWTSRFVAIVQLLGGFGRRSEQWSHLTLVSDKPGWEYGAQWPKVGHFPIDTSRPYEVWRIAELTDRQRADIIAYAKERVGDWYNMTGLLTGGLLGLPHTEVCSQEVGDAYAAARPPIIFNKEGGLLLSPDAVLDYPGAAKIQTPEGA